MQLSQQLGITLPITAAAFRLADSFAQRCPIQEKAEQIRRNTLAVYVVNAYLELMEIPTALEKSDSWSPMMQLMADVADLQVPGVGSLSCRAFAPDSRTCYVPPEDWRMGEDSHDAARAGYVAVALDEQNCEATLVGFTENVGQQEQVDLSLFAPIETLIDRVHGLSPTAAEASTSSVARSTAALAKTRTAVTQLKQWLSAQAEEIAVSGWQSVEQLVGPTANSFAFRASDFQKVEEAEQSIIDISRAKSVNLGIRLGQSVQIALVLHLTQAVQTAQTAQTEETAQADAGTAAQTHITLQVRPLNGDVLPEELMLKVLDDQGEMVASVISRAIDNYIQLQLSGESGELFSVEMTLEDARFAERFAI